VKLAWSGQSVDRPPGEILGAAAARVQAAQRLCRCSPSRKQQNGVRKSAADGRGVRLAVLRFSLGDQARQAGLLLHDEGLEVAHPESQDPCCRDHRCPSPT